MSSAPGSLRKRRTRKWILSRLSLLALSAVGLVAYTNCSKSPALTPLNSVNLASAPVQSVQVNFCEPPPVQQKLNIKTLIVLDHSGSNTQNYKMKSDGSGEPDLSTGTVVISPQYATDPRGLLRYGSPTATGSLLNYLAGLPANDPANPNRFFALVDFSDNAVSYPAGGSGFTSDIQSFSNYVSQDAGSASGGAPNDQGGTSYITALNMAYNIVNNDLQQEKACELLPTSSAPTAACPRPGVLTASSYVVLFMSDGSPIIKLGLAQTSTGAIVQQPLTSAQCPYPNQLIDGIICKESTQSILGLVGSISALAADKQHVAGVNMFTVYYYVPGNVDQASATLLGQMATTGNGVAYNALSGTSLNYSQFQPPQKQVQYSLADIFVTNTSGTWWNDGKFHADSDGDGLPDDIEKQWGSDPFNPMTQGNGVSDLVRYRLTQGAPCVSLASNGICTDTPTNYKAAACAGIPTSADLARPGAILFRASDPSGLNDCEKVLMNDSAGLGTPDSNQDSVPDFLEFKNNIPFQAGTSVAVNSPQLDGYSLYNKIKFNLPTQTSVANSPNLLPATYDLVQTSSQNLQNCYRLTVNGLPIVTATDKVRVDVRFKTNSANVSDQYRLGFKTFPGSNRNVIFNDWNDPGEIAGQTWRSWP